MIPLLAHRSHEVTVLHAALALSVVVLALYPFARTPWLMAACTTLLGLTLGSVQPMIMSTLRLLRSAYRHSEAVAVRSMAINASNSVKPMAFDVVGTALRQGVMFWVMSAAVGADSSVARGLQRAFAGSTAT